ncbi:MAG: F0F1 ATP synthase subunit epsilon [Clostridia bacterium]|nr:F0F1 ATP synthase subunit epsilon [Clostridia bacterium]
MNTFNLTVATPDGNRYQGEAEGLFVRGAEGDLAILAGHMPFITSVKAGKCRIQTPDGDERSATLDGGLLTVSDKTVTLLSGSFQWDEE